MSGRRWWGALGIPRPVMLKLGGQGYRSRGSRPRSGWHRLCERKNGILSGEALSKYSRVWSGKVKRAVSLWHRFKGIIKHMITRQKYQYFFVYLRDRHVCRIYNSVNYSYPSNDLCGLFRKFRSSWSWIDISRDHLQGLHNNFGRFQPHDVDAARYDCYLPRSIPSMNRHIYYIDPLDRWCMQDPVNLKLQNFGYEYTCIDVYEERRWGTR